MQSLRSLDSDPSTTLGQSLCRVVRDLAAQGWCQGTGGNFSVTLSREPLRLLSPARASTSAIWSPRA